MKILVAPDSFKGAATGVQIAKAIVEGLLEGNNKLETVALPLADGGEGTLDILQSVYGGKIHRLRVEDPLGRLIDAHYMTFENKAFIELAVASGLPLLGAEERDPVRASTYGTGQLIRDALDKGFSEIILSIGGSATNDAGLGLASAIGFRFYDQHDVMVYPNGGNLHRIHRIESPDQERTGSLKMKILCDVTNPFTGSRGAAKTYGKQKGASAEDIEMLERGMIHIREYVKKWKSIDLDDIPGTGAAGGVGGGMVALCNADLVSGIEYLMKELKLEEKVAECDLVITGEGSLDFQTLHGKTIGGLLKVAAEQAKPVVAFAGNILLSGSEIRDSGLAAAFSIQPGVVDLQTAMADTLKNIHYLSTNFARVLLIPS